ncbi:hypothetical protein [uncultured Bacteroides sp.]|jgi:lipoprotein|uniref:hypothetical protein n=1 Tax=uncultured Bacteroides sp. TaxID=162156 RepID=UPI00280BF61A|nr:hypothetical protein [uncultured Bacteroides sp.]
MKQIKIIGGTLLALLLAGCSDEIDTGDKMPVSGEEVAFGTYLQGFEEPEPTTRTIYGVPDGSDVENYDELTIKWVEGDQVRVYSPQAETGFQSADYTIAKGTAGTDATSYYLTKDGETGVRWGNTNQEHHFYAFYPTNIGHENKYQPITGLQSSTTVMANIPVAQEHGELFTWEDGKQPGNVDLPTGWKLIRPDMTYAMMAGHGVWTPSSNDDKVTIKFKPLVTVVDVVINGPASGQPDMKIYYVSVRSKTQPIVGNFSCTINENGNTTFDDMETEVTGDNNIATINCMYKDANGQPTPVTLKTNEKLTLKFFLLPRNIMASDLSVSVQVQNGRTLTQSLIPEGSDMKDRDLAQGKIVRVVTPNLTIPETSNWMSLIGDNVLFTELSLPGSRHSYTGDLYRSSSHNISYDSDIMQFYQALNVTDKVGDEETQFDMGIRAFDLKIYNDNNQGINYVYAGGGVVGSLTLEEVLDNLKEKLQVSSKEACVVFLNYVSPPGKSDWTNRVVHAVENWDRTKSTLMQINANTTMNDMRGKIAVVVNVPDDTPVSSSVVNYIHNFNSSAECAILNTQLNGNLPLHMQSGERMNNPQITSDPTNTYAIHGTAGLIPYYLDQKIKQGDTTSGDLLQEKENLMTQLFQQMRDGQQGLYLNDLAGFCVVKHHESTGYVNARMRTFHKGSGLFDPDYWEGLMNRYQMYCYCPQANYYGTSEPSDPQDNATWFQIESGDDGDHSELGQGGNTVVFAQEFNQRAMTAIYEMVNEGRVPLGVVLTNFAGSEQVEIDGRNYDVYGETLPSIIMSNNFMFTLDTKEGTGN